MDILENTRDTPEGIPKFFPSVLTAFRSLITPRSHFLIDKTKGPFSVEQLAAHSTRCLLLVFYRRLWLLGLASLIGLWLLLTHKVVTTTVSTPHQLLLFLYPLLAVAVLALPAIVYLLRFVVAPLHPAFSTILWRTPYTPVPPFMLLRLEVHRTALFFLFILVFLAFKPKSWLHFFEK